MNGRWARAQLALYIVAASDSRMDHPGYPPTFPAPIPWGIGSFPTAYTTNIEGHYVEPGVCATLLPATGGHNGRDTSRRIRCALDRPTASSWRDDRGRVDGPVAVRD